MASSIDQDAALARAAFLRGDFETANYHANVSVSHDPADLDIRCLRAKSAIELAIWPEALSDIRHLIAERPHDPQFRDLLALYWLRIGNAHKASGESNSAIAAYRQAAQSAPTQVDACFHLGSLLMETGNPREALPLLAAVARYRSDDADAALKLAEAELACGALQNAARRLLEWQSRLDSGAARRNGSVLLLRARCDDAATALAVRVAQEGADAWAWCWHFAVHMRAKGDLKASRTVLAALRDAQTEPVLRMRAELGLALGLPAAYASAADLSSVRAQFEQNLRAFVTEYSAEKIRLIAPTPDKLCWDNFFLTYQGKNDLPLQALFGHWLSGCLAVLLPEFATAPRPSARVRPRLVMISSYFHECTVGWYFASWVETLARRNWELILVHTSLDRDALTERLARSAHGEVTLCGTLAENARAVRELAADMVLYPELGMDRDVFALAALRLAPHQVCAWGHPVTSGLPTMDVFLSCAEMEPANAREHYTERVMTLPTLGTRYLSPGIPPTMTRQQMGLPEQRTLYLVPQTLYKLHPDTDSILVEIVRRDPAALFVLFELSSPSPVLRVHERLMRALAQVSAEPRRHLHWFAECSRENYLHINLACDVMIDGLHWSGGNTSLDALHCGLPVVTCPGPFMRGRQSAAMLRALDCSELIAQSPEELAQIAVSVARDSQLRARLVARIREHLPGLTQSDAPLEALDRALREILTGPAS
jgi:tetratricopeptide (TPR) repeat protein